jgi:tyrosinase
MINPDTAALDPIFWLHHANIDRLWSVWNRISSSNTDPTGSVNVGGQNISWQTSVPFPFHDATGNEVTMTPSQVLDTTTTSFSYDYEETGNPLSPSLMESFALTRSISMKPRPAEMVGATDKPVTLTGSPETTAFVLQPPSGPAIMGGAEPKTYLKIENVVSEKSHATYEVYVNLPDNADAAARKEHYAGAMPLFGVIQASARSDRHAGNGLGFSLDITQLVNRLKARNAWDDQNIRVTFVPRSTGGTARAAVAGHAPIRVGRVSLYRA